MPRRALAALVVLLGLLSGCGEKDPKILRQKFRDALEGHYADLRRVAIKEREIDAAPLVHDFIAIQYPEKNEEQMPVAKRKALYGKDDPEAEKPLEGVLEAEVSYQLVTYKRQDEKLVIPDNPVDQGVKPDKVETHEDVRSIYVPAVYRRGKERFLYYSGRLVPEAYPREEPLTEDERLTIVMPPK